MHGSVLDVIFEVADPRFIPTRCSVQRIFEVSNSPFRPYVSLELTGLSDTP